MISHYFNRRFRDEFSIHENSPTTDLNITGNADIGGTITVGSVSLDNTEDKIVVWNSVDKTLEYRELATLNPFNQDLNTFNSVEFDSINLDGFTLMTSTQDKINFAQTPDPAVSTETIFAHESTIDNGAVILKVNNRNDTITAHSAIQVEMKAFGSFPDPGGNSVGIFNTYNSSSWTIGKERVSDEFKIAYNSSNSNFLTAPADEKLSLDSSGLLSVSNLNLSNITQNDTRTNILVLDPSNGVQFRDVTSLPVVNPFDQDLNTFDPVEFDQVSINGNADITATSDSSLTINQTPAVLSGEKSMILSSETASNFILFVQNRSAAATAHTALILQTDRGACTGGGGNQCILYDTCSIGGWEVGKQRTTNTYRWNYGFPSYLTNDADTRMFLDTSGNLNMDGSLTLEDNIVLSRTSENDSRQVMTPVNQTVPASHTIFNYSDQHFQLAVSNENATAGSHSVLTLRSDGASANNGGNNVILMSNDGGTTDSWNIGKKKTDSTFRWNYGNADYLTNDTNTKLKLSSLGVLTLNENVVISAGNDSNMTSEQSPAITTGIKGFTHISDTSDSAVELQVYNKNNAATAHSGMYIRTDLTACSGNGGNQFIQFESCGLVGWTIGHQKSSDTFRWNRMVTASQYLTNDANTLMFLDNLGNLNINGALNQSGVALSVNAPYYGGVETTGAGAKVKRTGVTLNNNSTLNVIAVAGIGTNYPITSGVVRNFTLGTEWTNVGSTLTYVGADIIYVQINGSVTVSGTSGDVIQVSILVNGTVYAASTTTVNGTQRHNMSCSYCDQVVSGQTVSLQVANLSAVRNFNVHSGHLSVSSF